MQRGVIGVPSYDDRKLTTVEPYHQTRKEYGFTLNAALDPTEQRTLEGGTKFIEGDALLEDTESDSGWRYDTESGISTDNTRAKTQEHTGFVAVPAANGHNGFAMVTTSAGEFAFQVIGRADSTVMSRAEIQLGDFYLDREDDFTIQTGGQQGRLDKADTVMAWGQSIEADDDLGSTLHDAARANTLPQLAGNYTSDALDRMVRVNLAASGYVEVWDPDLSTYEFLEWVQSDILPYVQGAPDDLDASERAEEDPNQPGLDEFDGETCNECDRESDTLEDGFCVVCRDKREEQQETERTTIDDLDTVTETGGDGDE